ncbi:unnamed protein product [Candidula unifasciata]|uniref:BTB domain-containing protein n=1 Tax=Candidula unifasciata TaxID=100452 RepID=A0A8S3ZI62_9EUPU|nr:unnamed protein product [Candidula unifasciata]
MESAGAEILISNYSGLSCRLLNLLTSSDLCDVQLQVGEYRFDTHKLILCASSDVFKTMLTNQKWTEAHKQSVVLVEEPVCEPVFDRFVNYIYSGQLYISHSTVCPLLTLADKYNVREMIPLCRSYMLQSLDAPLTSSCVLQWWENANMRNDVELESAILDYIECNFNKVIQTPDFISANLDTVEKLLVSSKLAVHNEAMILYGVMVWLQSYMDCHHPPVYTVREVVWRLTRHIRWPMMTEEELKCIRECADVQRFLQTYGSFMYLPNINSRVISEASLSETNTQEASILQHLTKVIDDRNIFKYSGSTSDPFEHMISDKQGHSSSSCSKMRTDNRSWKQASVEEYEINRQMSRVYTCDYWCTALTVSNFLAFPQYATQTFFFSTPWTGYRHDDGHTLDWEVELCPKGVHFPPAILIGLERDGNKLVDESYIRTVRLSLMSRSPQELPLKVEVNVLVRANSLSEPQRSFVERCHRRTCIFDSKHQRYNLDDIVPYEKFATYLRPDGLTPQVYLAPTVAFTVYIVIRPLPLYYSK